MDKITFKYSNGIEKIYLDGEYVADLLYNGTFRYYPITPKKIVSYLTQLGFKGKPEYFDAT